MRRSVIVLILLFLGAWDDAPPDNTQPEPAPVEVAPPSAMSRRKVHFDEALKGG